MLQAWYWLQEFCTTFILQSLLQLHYRHMFEVYLWWMASLATMLEARNDLTWSALSSFWHSSHTFDFVAELIIILHLTEMKALKDGDASWKGPNEANLATLWMWLSLSYTVSNRMEYFAFLHPWHTWLLLTIDKTWTKEEAVFIFIGISQPSSWRSKTLLPTFTTKDESAFKTRESLSLKTHQRKCRYLA